MSCKLWSKVTSVFLNIMFCAKMSILGQKNWNCVRNVDCALLLSVNMLLKNMPIFRKLWLFVWMSIYIKKLPKSEKKTSIFLRKCLFVFHLLENCYFDSKYHFIRWYFGQKCHFPSKIYISSGIYSFEKSSSFLRKGVNLVVNYGKSDNWFGVNFYKTLGIFCCKKIEF